ncbi:hypothetical protein [Roseibacillus persicicus]|uniref:hypothetical protein n=1 Tax=Roseibacillus persicicus TaxID=454148 RepID=UPI002811007F|nr:hypothetical protein [Roseibacillus persicicus]
MNKSASIPSKEQSTTRQPDELTMVPTGYHSWKIQSRETQKKLEKLSRKKFQRSHSFWHSRDLHLVAACLATAALVAAVYYLLKSP